MRVPHYLVKTPSGTWHFRRRMPVSLIGVLGKPVIKRTLGTRELPVARDIALNLWRAYDELHTYVRTRVMAGKKDVAEIIAGLTGEGRHYRLIRKPDGSIEVEAKGKEDHAHAMEAVEKIGTLANEPYVQQLMREAAQQAVSAQHAPALPTQAPSPVVVASQTAFPSPASLAGIPALPIGKVVAEWLSDIKSGTVPKTLSIKRTAVEGFASHYGEKNSLRDAGRIDVGQWVMALRNGGLTTPTIVNKCSYLRGFFDWAKGKGYYPKFAKDDNPAAGQIVYGVREKRARRKHGFKAFTEAELQILYGPAFLAKLPSTVQLGAWIGLYTGARVSEVGQLMLSDFIEVDGIPCIRINDDTVGQSLKNDASSRTIPVHPELIRLGLLDHVAELRKKGEKKLFPKVKVDAVNGQGNWLSKAFSRHVELALPKPDMGKLGFHSLRKTVVQTLQVKGVTAELRAAYVGHDLDDEHHTSYSANPKMSQLLEAVSQLAYPVSPASGAA